MTDQRCGTCRWWVLDQEHINHDFDMGTCTYPLPFFVDRIQPYRHAGTQCHTYERRES